MAACSIGTGNKGKIYRLSGDPLQPTLLTRATAQQVTALLRDNDGRVTFTTSNPGKVLRLSPMRADRGTYTSDVRDAQTIATWGAIRWQAACTAGTRASRSRRDPATRARRMKRGVTGRRHTSPGRKSDLEPSGALSPVARGLDRQQRRRSAAHIGDRRISAAKHPAGGDCRSRSIRRERYFSAPSRPATRRLRDLMATFPIAAMRRSKEPVDRMSAAASIRRDCSRSRGARRTRIATTSSTTCSIGARARRRGSR